MNVNIKKVKVGVIEYEVLHLSQSDLGLETWVYPETQINVYGNDIAIKTLADIYDLVSIHKLIAVMERHSPDGADLVIFHGQSTPLNFRLVHQLKKSIKKGLITRTFDFCVRPDSKEDKMNDDWKFTTSLTVRAEDHLVLISGSELGLRLSALECLYLTENDLGHQHFDWWSTKKSVELIIRNTERDD
ncbi:hypothetical protein [Pseudoneobacillus sp. C159]